MTDDEAVTVLNAWRRLAGFVALIGGREQVPSGVVDLVREFVEPAMLDLNTLADRLPAEQLNATVQAPSAWFPNLQEPRWHRAQPNLSEGKAAEERGRLAVEDPTAR